MSGGHRTLKDQMLARLMTATGWLQGSELAQGLSGNRLAIEDALADLVLEKTADYKAQVGYRLAGTALCRQALRALKKRGGHQHVQSQVFEGVCRVGVAEQREGLGTVMYELEMPLPPAGPDFMAQYQRQINGLLQFSRKEKSNG